MPQKPTLDVAGRIHDWWSIAQHDVASDPFGRMASVGLFQIGLPGAEGELDTYQAIAVAERIIAVKSGLLGLASAFAARQLAARFFIVGFGSAEQRADLLPRIASGQVCAAIAISEPDVGAHPKHLKTTAQSHGGNFIIQGRKAWITNGAIANVFLVLAVTGIEGGVKRYGLFLVPKDTIGLSVKPMKALDALAPASHCELELEECKLPQSARLGDSSDAYAAMALPFRDVEDTVGTANISGLLTWLLENAAGQIDRSEENALRLGRIAGLVSVVHAASRAAVAALDGQGENDAAGLIGVRLLARDIVTEIREMLSQGSTNDAIGRTLAAFDLLASVAREPRKVRQIRVGNSLWSATRA